MDKAGDWGTIWFTGVMLFRQLTWMGRVTTPVPPFQLVELPPGSNADSYAQYLARGRRGHKVPPAKKLLPSPSQHCSVGHLPLSSHSWLSLLLLCVFKPFPIRTCYGSCSKWTQLISSHLSLGKRINPFPAVQQSHPARHPQGGSSPESFAGSVHSPTQEFPVQGLWKWMCTTG